MFNHRSDNERGLTAPLPAPRFIAWWVWSLAGLAGLIVVLWWAGRGRPAWEGGGPFVFLAQVCGGLGAMFRAEKGVPTGARLAFFLALLQLLYLFWRATRAALAYRPGPVDVQPLEDATPPGTEKPSDADLTAKLRQRLSESSMYPPSTLPAQAPAESFLELLGDIQIDPNKLGTALPKVLSRLRPKLAYRVSGILQWREAEPDQYGMTVTVTSFLFGGSRAMSVWGTDWDDVIRKAGIWVVSTMLPVTRLGRLPPWRHWWGRELNADLYQAYQEATEANHAGRLPEALEKYFIAVELDPTNPYLRAELAETQEKMGRHIDALDTYQRALSLDGETAGDYQRRLWQTRWNPHWRRLRYLRHPRRYRDLLGLRYRNSIILGTQRAAEEWYRRAGASDDRTHEGLIPVLVERYWPAVTDLDYAGRVISESEREGAKRSLTEILQKSSSTAQHSFRNEENEVRLVFQRASMQEMTRLSADDAWARFVIYWPTWLWSWARTFWPAAYLQSVHGAQQSISRRTFRINRRVWAPLRLAWVSSECSRGNQQICEPQRWRRRYTWRPATKLSWEGLTVRCLDSKLRMAWTSSRRDWLPHYNAACIYAIAMNAPSRAENCKEELAERAIAHLEKAVLTPKWSFAVVERTWMVKEDPDLIPLRDNRPLFDSFVRTAYPSVEGSVRTDSANDFEEQPLRYDYRLLEETAKVMQQVWRQRSGESVDIHVAIEWLQVERDIWESIYQIVDPDRRGEWRDRVDLIHRIQVNCRPVSYSTPGFPPPMLPNDTVYADRDLTISQIDGRLKALDSDVRSSTSLSLDTPYPNSLEGQRILRNAAVDGVARLDLMAVRRLSTGYAAAWQTLGDWLASEASERLFRQALGKVPQLTRRFFWEVTDGRKVQV
ncbi:tetratricopeptide repeat protein [Streptomyces sp. ISL-99]|uniref:tetratricopeptide repeat protein n=1 Tax=Streptomyces sp. ISL-99 TaxID=2819193 RepID=UPI001BE59D19|nr:tetratricopeptide repeat protein [Streptomyces sp. ISL-99]MBT2525116.1 tetratricopeptide repeat protein [Streptomyces sp. ISL-99]